MKNDVNEIIKECKAVVDNLSYENSFNIYKKSQKKPAYSVNLSKLIENVLIRNKRKYEYKSIQVQDDILDIRLIVNETILEDILDELISNAFKYSFNKSTIDITVRALKHILQIYIESKGIQIYDDEQDDIFKNGYRGYEAVKKVKNGKGTGLYKARKLVELIGGSVSLVREKSNKQNINIFKITLPMSLVEQNEKLP